MNFLSATYCPTRRTLEKESWNMVSDLSAIAARILAAAGVNHDAFIEATTECKRMRLLIQEANWQVRAHRESHGC